jgi:hypothetical protein
MKRKQQNYKTRSILCLELSGEGGKGWGRGRGVRNDPNNVCTCELKN